MRLEQVAATLFTLRDYCKTSADFAATAKKVRAIGYPAVQISAVPLPEPEIVAVCKGEGLTICATHESGQVILDDPQRAIDRLHQLGCSHTAYPYPAGVTMTDRAQVEELARKLDASGAVFREAGLTLSYHNHAIEFVRHGDRTALDIIYSTSKAENLKAELDTYWVQFGGACPSGWVRKMKGRLPLLHMKDYAFTGENKPEMAEIGGGNLCWKNIVEAAEESGCEWFIVEQDICPRDPFDCLRASFEYIAANLVARPK